MINYSHDGRAIPDILSSDILALLLPPLNHPGLGILSRQQAARRQRRLTSVAYPLPAPHRWEAARGEAAR